MTPPFWQLYGTLGCHLCEQAEQSVQLFAQARAVHLEQIDIADLPTPHMMSLSTRIPVLQTVHQQLQWPFSYADLMQAYQIDLAHNTTR